MRMKPWIPERGWASGPDRPVSGLLPSSASLSPLPVPGHLAPVPLTAFVVAGATLPVWLWLPRFTKSLILVADSRHTASALRPPKARPP